MIELEPQWGMLRGSRRLEDARQNRGPGLDRLAALQRAIQKRELSLYFQPVVSLDDRQPVGVQGRLTWLDPHRGVRPVDDIMDLADRHGLIPLLIRAQFEQACGLIATLNQVPLEGGPTFVALSVPARHLSDRAVIDDFVQILHLAGIDPSLLAVTLSDLTSLSGRYGVRTALNTLRTEGIGVEFGQFRGGASSLRDLQGLPFTNVKIDSSLVDGIEENSEDLAMVAGVVSLTHALGLTCTADGVSDADQAGTLTDLGCDLGQGDLWGHAVSERDLQAVVRGLRRPSASRD